MVWTLLMGAWLFSNFETLMLRAGAGGSAALVVLTALSTRLAVWAGGAGMLALFYLVFGSGDQIVDAEAELGAKAVGDDFSGATSEPEPVEDPVLRDQSDATPRD